MSDNLVKRLRDWEHVWPDDMDKPAGHLYDDAADRIEQLEREAKIQEVILESIIEGRDATFALMLKRAETAEAKLAKAVEWAEKVREYAISWDDKYLVERSNEILAAVAEPHNHIN